MLIAPGMRPFSNAPGSRTSSTTTAFCSIKTLSSSMVMRGTARTACPSFAKAMEGKACTKQATSMRASVFAS